MSKTYEVGVLLLLANEKEVCEYKKNHPELKEMSDEEQEEVLMSIIKLEPKIMYKRLKHK